VKRPSFQFYPGDWRLDGNLRRCSHAARGAWVDVLCLLHDAPEYGVLRWPLAEIAAAAGAPLELLRELVDKGVMGGADAGAEPFVWTPSHAGKQGEPVVLVEPGAGPCWYSRRFVRDEAVRLRRGAASRFTAENQPKPTPTGRVGERQGDGPSSSSSSSNVATDSSLREPARSFEPEHDGDPYAGLREAATPTVYGLAAVALNRAGVRCTSLNPDLIHAVDLGATVDHLLQLAALHPGKPIAYLCRIAERELTETPTTGEPRHDRTPAAGLADRAASRLVRILDADPIDRKPL
jgi:hypothetical protein